MLVSSTLCWKLNRANRRGDKESHPIWKGRNTTCLFAVDMILYIENPKQKITKALLELINIFSEV